MRDWWHDRAIVAVVLCNLATRRESWTLIVDEPRDQTAIGMSTEPWTSTIAQRNDERSVEMPHA